MAKHLHKRAHGYNPKLGGLAGAVIAVALALSGYTWPVIAAPQPQGYVEVTRYTALITRAALQDGVPPISLAAGIMNQGSAFTRPFGTDLLERVQVAAPFDSSVTGQDASVGIAQLMPNEMSTYLRGCRTECLFEAETAVRGMAAKLAAADDLLPRRIDPTDRLMVLALAQNAGPGAARAYLARGGRWDDIYADGLTGYASGLYNNDQLRKILADLRFLAGNGFRLPLGVDLERWQQIVDTQGRSQA